MDGDYFFYKNPIHFVQNYVFRRINVINNSNQNKNISYKLILVI